MPLPKPKAGESRKDFMQRCMSDSKATSEFPNTDQRLAVCSTQYRDKYEKVELESYNDYPASASNNAKKAIKYKEENGSSCGTKVGWTRARQLADKKNISRDTIARMASFKRHQQHKDVPYSEGCGGLMWDAWGGSSGINWAINKLKKIDKK
tara:strand:- start:6306 stop:6761 length:456 start_codon:yes stop_codon:yes gene_type:complete